jgi:tripartite-type tricarboxylate transporter receptor subunit TctC
MRPFKQIIVATLLGLATAAALAQSAEVKARLKALKPADYPTRPIELSLGFGAGGGMDVVARAVAQKFQEYTGETVVVNNRTGAGGLVFHRWLVSQAPADGYAIGLGNNIIIGDALLRSEGKWSYKDADSIAFVNYEPVIWFTSSTGRFRGQPLGEIMKAAQKDRGGVKVGTISATLLEMLAEQVEHKASVSLNKIPFNGGKPSIAALMGDHIDISFGFLGEVKGLGDKVRPIAVASQHPAPTLPGVPTFNSVLKADDVNWIMWRYIAAPRGIPADRKAWLVAAFNEVMKDPKLIAELEQQGGIQDPSLDTPAKVSAELDRLAKAERAFYVQTGRMK